MKMPGFTAETSFQWTASHRQVAGFSPRFDKTVYPSMPDTNNPNPVSSTSGWGIDPQGWYNTPPFQFGNQVGTVHPNQVDAFGKCMSSCIAGTNDYEACRTGCCQQFTKKTSCVIP